MFTGLIEDLGSVQALHQDDGGTTIEIATALAPQIVEGDSVAVNGVCLTATELQPHSFSSQAMHETLRRSSLGALQVGSAVNIELALRADARLGGHIVQGHVDGTAAVTAVHEDGFARVLDFEIAGGADDDHGGGLMRYLVEKGSVALDGVSLTVSALREGSFSVSLIPETLQRTNLGGLQAGDRVNIEVDVLAKHVERLMGTYGGAGRRPRSLAYQVRHARCVLAQLALRAHQRPKEIRT
ncbi:MAG: riboflavin synthase [Solirubrobacteraceae bacterium]